MARFVKFISWSMGSPILVNVDHITDVHVGDGDGCIHLYQDFCVGDDGPSTQSMLVVRGTLDEVQARLNGEPPAPAVVAHPSAVGWVQNPDLPR